MRNNICPACGIVLHRRSSNLAVCPRCFRSFRAVEPNLRAVAAPNPQANGSDLSASDWKVLLTVIGMIFLLIFCAVGRCFPVIPIILVFGSRSLVKLAEKADRADKENQKIVIPAASGEKFRTHQDYLNQFRILPLHEMPLGKYGYDAIDQIHTLERKMDAMKAMLPANHPFLENAAEAERYILANCKQVIYRLRFCDQSDPVLCRRHAEYLQARIQENQKVLRDFEELIIEVSQMSDSEPAAAPCLDVLAETLYKVRTGEAEPQQMHQMMMM